MELNNHLILTWQNSSWVPCLDCMQWREIKETNLILNHFLHMHINCFNLFEWSHNEWIITFCQICEQRVNFQIMNHKLSIASAYGNCQIYSHVETCSKICHIVDLNVCLCANVYLGVLWDYVYVLYGLELSLFSLPARQEMKCVGCCGKGTLPVYP